MISFLSFLSFLCLFIGFFIIFAIVSKTTTEGLDLPLTNEWGIDNHAGYYMYSPKLFVVVFKRNNQRLSVSSDGLRITLNDAFKNWTFYTKIDDGESYYVNDGLVVRVRVTPNRKVLISYDDNHYYTTGVDGSLSIVPANYPDKEWTMQEHPTFLYKY